MIRDIVHPVEEYLEYQEQMMGKPKVKNTHHFFWKPTRVGNKIYWLEYLPVHKTRVKETKKFYGDYKICYREFEVYTNKWEISFVWTEEDIDRLSKKERDKVRKELGLIK